MVVIWSGHLSSQLRRREVASPGPPVRFDDPCRPDWLTMRVTERALAAETGAAAGLRDHEHRNPASHPMIEGETARALPGRGHDLSLFAVSDLESPASG